MVSDDVAREILLAPASERSVDLGRRLGLKRWHVERYRNRRTQHSIRIAKELGLIRPNVSPVRIAPHDGVAERRLISSIIEG